MRAFMGVRAAFAAFLFAAGPSAATGQEAQGPSGPVIVTSGTGEVRVAPDRGTLTLGVQTRAATAAAAAAENARKQARVISAIKALGIAADQIGTSGYTVRPETQFDRQGQSAPRTPSYFVANMVTVEIRRIDGIAALIDASLAAGANEVQGLTFSIADPDSARRVALAQAVARARADAEAAARAAGGTLGPLIELHASQHEMPDPRSYGGVARLAMEAAPPIEAGTSTVSATVTVRWQFVPAQPR